MNSSSITYSLLCCDPDSHNLNIFVTSMGIEPMTMWLEVLKSVGETKRETTSHAIEDKERKGEGGRGV